MNKSTSYSIGLFFGWLFVTVVYANPVIELVSGAKSLAAEQSLCGKFAESKFGF